VFTEEQLADFGDSPYVATQPESPVGYALGSDEAFALAEAGGMKCSWSSEGGTIGIAVLASAAVPDIASETCGPGYGEGTMGDNFCGIERETNGVRITGGVSAPDAGSAQAAAERIIAAFDDSAIAEVAPTFTRPVGAWSNPVDCPALDDAIDVEALFGVGVAYNGEVGGDVGPYRAIRPLLNELQGLSCLWIGADGRPQISVSVHGGGRWSEAELSSLPTVTPVDIVGVEAAYLEERSSSASVALHVYDGSNWLILSTWPDDVGTLYPAAVTIVDALNNAPEPDPVASETGDSSSTDVPASMEPQITDLGLGDLVIGEPVPSDTTLVEWNPDVCGGQWVPAGEDQQNFASSFWVETTDGKKGSPIVRITILSADYLTTSGVHVGSSLDDLKAASPAFTKVDKTQGFDLNLYVLENSVAQTVYNVVKPGGALEDAAENTVAYIKVEAASLLAHPVPQESCGA
jgi:hypothetical protein